MMRVTSGPDLEIAPSVASSAAGSSTRVTVRELATCRSRAPPQFATMKRCCDRSRASTHARPCTPRQQELREPMICPSKHVSRDIFYKARRDRRQLVAHRGHVPRDRHVSDATHDSPPHLAIRLLRRRHTSPMNLSFEAPPRSVLRPPPSPCLSGPPTERPASATCPTGHTRSAWGAHRRSVFRSPPSSSGPKGTIRRALRRPAPPSTCPMGQPPCASARSRPRLPPQLRPPPLTRAC